MTDPPTALSRYTARKRTRPRCSSSAGPTNTSAHMLNRMSMNPRPFRPAPGTMNADVISRYHSPAATPCTGPEFV